MASMKFVFLFALLCGVAFAASGEKEAKNEGKQETEKQIPEESDIEDEMLDEDELLDDEMMDPGLRWGVGMGMRPWHMMHRRPWMLQRPWMIQRPWMHRPWLLHRRGMWGLRHWDDDETEGDDVENDEEVAEDPTLLLRRGMMVRRVCLPGRLGCHRRWMLRRPLMWSRWGMGPMYRRRIHGLTRLCDGDMACIKKNIIQKQKAKIHDEEETVEEPAKATDKCARCTVCRKKCVKGKVCCPRICQDCPAEE